MNIDMEQMINESFTQYAGAVLQSRALVDVRDGLKPSARQIFYCMETDNFTHNKPFKKTLKAIGSAFRTYIHGDSSAEGVIMRAGQPFAYRYPLVEVEGAYGNQMESGNWSAPRYTESRLSQLSEYLFKDLDKETIAPEDWKDNYDDTEKYPRVLPCKGFYPLTNGTFGIGLGASSSVPPMNLKEVNEAIIKLINDPDIDARELVCLPDFPTGATVLNKDEVIESLINGRGASCKIRSTIEYDEKERCLIATEIPYNVYTNTICSEIEQLANDDERNPGIIRLNDLTGEKPCLKIYLKKSANPTNVIKVLLKETSLQSYYSINLTMLKDGRFPTTFGWKQCLEEYVAHQRAVYRRGYEHDLRVIEARLHILEGLLIAIENVDAVVKLIKSSSTPAIAAQKLCETYDLDDIQAKAILKITLSRLANMEVKKIVDEQKDLTSKAESIKIILSDARKLDECIIKDLQDVAKKFGDARRTKVINIEKEEEDTVELKNLLVRITNHNRLIFEERSSLYKGKRAGKGKKLKMDDGELVIDSAISGDSGKMCLFTKQGKYYVVTNPDVTFGAWVYAESIIDLAEGDQLVAVAFVEDGKDVYTVTEKGFIKKTSSDLYNTKLKKGAKGISLTEGDKIASIFCANADAVITTVSSDGHIISFMGDTVREVGLTAKGVVAMKLNDGAVIADACGADDTKALTGTSLVTVTKGGMIKKSPFNLSIKGRATKGVKCMGLKEGDSVSSFVITREKEVTVLTHKAQLTLNLDEIDAKGYTARGVIAIKMADDEVLSVKESEN